MTLSWQHEAQDGAARAGVLHTAHGEVPTPVFMSVGTAGTVKAMTADAVRATGARMVLGNTYHLMLRPGAERIARLGGLHRFMDWHGPILTDSGGFQVMSLSGLRKMDADGVTFQSHIDGSRHRLTPERSVEIQHLLGADVTMCFDECTPFPATHEQAATSMRLSMRWAAREDGLVIAGIFSGRAFGAGDIGRQGNLAGLFKCGCEPRLIRAEIKPRGAAFGIIQHPRGAILSAFNLQFIAGLKAARIADQRMPNARFLMPVQHDFNPRLAAPGMKPRGDDARIIHHHHIARAKQRRQITHAAIFRAIRAHHQHACRIARADGRLRDQMVRQDEIIIIQPQRRGLSQHPGAVARSRRGRNRPGPTRPAARPEATAKRGIFLSPACSRQL